MASQPPIQVGVRPSDPVEPKVVGMGSSHLVRHWGGCERTSSSPTLLLLHLGFQLGWE